MIWKVFMNISAKRAVLPSMSSARRLHYEGVIYRFKFLMIATLLCASLTVVGFILGQVKYRRNIILLYVIKYVTKYCFIILIILIMYCFFSGIGCRRSMEMGRRFTVGNDFCLLYWCIWYVEHLYHCIIMSLRSFS